MPGPSKVPQGPEQNRNQAGPPDAGKFPEAGGAPLRSLGASVNGNGPGVAQTASRIAEMALMAEHRLRSRTRGVVYEMLGDGSLLEGLQRALEVNARDRFADPRPDVGNAQAEKQRFEKNYARTGAGSSSPGTPPTRPPSDRYRQFLDVQDVEIDRIMNLIAGLEDRLAFIIYDGPSESTNQTSGSGEAHAGPTNRLETELFDRANRLSVLRVRLEQLHTNLRI